MTEYTFTDINPKYARGYRLGGVFGLLIQLKTKPVWLHRKMMLWCFGWEWIDD